MVEGEVVVALVVRLRNEDGALDGENVGDDLIGGDTVMCP